jgi:response regulator RpfG family c-di-GMP phosphodiesterase
MAKILIIDDDPDIVEAMKMVLEHNKYEVITADEGELGYKMAKVEMPDLIILDVMMATIDQGFHISYKLKQDEKLKSIPILMVTSISEKTKFKFDRKRDEDFIPVDDFVEKPIKPGELIAKIEKMLSK